jgi:hypothetical protein
MPYCFTRTSECKGNSSGYDDNRQWPSAGDARSHREGQKANAGVTLHAEPGDVLLMSPLLFHRSGESKPGCLQHQRILHLEFTGVPIQPDGYEWHTLVPFSGGRMSRV